MNPTHRLRVAIASGLALLTLQLVLLVSHTRADMVSAYVIQVHDGDTATVQVAHGRPFHVRLNGIDAPELAQPFGAESRDHLRDQILGQPVILDIAHLDVYGRTIARILHAGRDENLEQIKGGFAWCYRSYLRDLSLTNRAAYQTAEDDAKKASLGLWNLPTPLAPWLFRHQQRYGR